MNGNKFKKYRFIFEYIPHIVIVIVIIMSVLFGINYYNKKLQIEK